MKFEFRQIVIFLQGSLLSIPLFIPFDIGLHYRVIVGSLIALPLVLLYLLFQKQIRIPRSDSLFIMIIAFILVSSVSAWIGTIRYNNISGVISFIYQLILLSYFLFGLLLLRNSKDILIFFRGIVCTTILICIIILIYLFSINSYENISFGHKILMVQYDEDVSGTLMINSIFGWPNNFGSFLVIVLMFCMSLLDATSKKSIKFFYLLAIPLLVLTIVFTFSRTAYLMAILSILTWILIQKGFKKKVVVASTTVFIIILIFKMLPAIADWIEYMGSFYVRLTLQNFMLERIDALSFIAGHGYQSWEIITEKYASEDIMGYTVSALSTHNEYLTILLKSGIFGFLLFIGVLFIVYRRVHHLSIKVSDYRVRKIFASWYCVLGPLFLSLFVQETLRYWPVSVIFWMLSGSLLNFQTQFIETESEHYKGHK